MEPIKAPIKKVDPADHPAVAKAILKLLDSPEKHCKGMFGRDLEGRPSPYNSAEKLSQICLHTAFNMVTGNRSLGSDEVNKFTFTMSGTDQICAINNEWSFEKITQALKDVSEGKVWATSAAA